MSQRYLPTGATPQLVIQSLNDYLGTELAVCGSWSPTIFYSDLKDYPATSKRTLADLVHQANQLEQKGDSMPYLEFFEKSRGHPRQNVSDKQKEIWTTFEQGSVMLYFEPIFLRLLQTPTVSEQDQVVLLYIKALGSVPVVKWNGIVEQLGACCYQFFGKEPESYAGLVDRKKGDDPQTMTDQELLEAIGSKLSPTKYSGRVSVHDSRSSLIRKYEEVVKR